MIFETDKNSLEGVFAEAAEALGWSIAKNHFGEEYMDWTVSGGATWGGNYTFDFRFDQGHGEDATFQIQIAGVRNMDIGAEGEGNGCPECERSYGPDFTEPCTEH